MIDIDIEKIKAAALAAKKYGVGSLASLLEFDELVDPESVLEIITRLEELQELYASSAFNTNYWKGIAESAERDAARYRFIDDTVGYAACAYVKGLGWSPSNTYEIDEAMKEKP